MASIIQEVEISAASYVHVVMDFKGIETDVGLIDFEWFWRLDRFALSPCIKPQTTHQCGLLQKDWRCYLKLQLINNANVKL